MSKAVEKVIVVTHTPFDQISLRRVCQKYELIEISWYWLDSGPVLFAGNGKFSTFWLWTSECC